MNRFDKFYSADARNLRPSPIRALSRIMNDPAIISFAGGAPNPQTFPSELIAECADAVIRKSPSTSLQYGPTRGLASLREKVAAICTRRGFKATSESVLLTTGSQQALHLLSSVLLDPGDVVLVELPTYIGGTAAFHARRAELVGVKLDDDGIDPDAFEKTVAQLERDGKSIRFLYTIPNFQNPSGRLMRQARRADLLELASRHDILVVEDDPYGELVYSNDADTTPIKARDSEDRVLYLGSFSKVLSPALRCGWIAGAAEILARIELAKESADLCSGILDESIIDEFCSRGLLDPQIANVRAFYSERRRTLLTALASKFTGHARWTEALGGLFTFLTLDRELDTASMIDRAVQAGVAYIPGGAFFVDGSGANSMRLTFAKEPDDRMREGVDRLAELFLQES